MSHVKSLRLHSFLLVFVLFIASVLCPAAPARAQPDASFQYNVISITCLSGGTQIQHNVRYSLYLPIGYTMTIVSSDYGTRNHGPYADAVSIVDVPWNIYRGAAPQWEEVTIFNELNEPVFQAGYTANCSGVADGGPANVAVTYQNPNEQQEDEQQEQEEPALPVPGPDLVNIPAGSAVGAFVATTPIYFAPGADAVTSTVMQAGKTIWVIGIDATGQFYKVLLAGKFFWVPTNTLGPNYDQVWNGTPLPTQVVN